MPSCLDQYLSRTRLQSGKEVVCVPLPSRLSAALRVRVLTTFHGIVDDSQRTTPACQRAADTNREVFPALLGIPLTCGLPVYRDTKTKDVPVSFRGHEVPTAAAESLR